MGSLPSDFDVYWHEIGYNNLASNSDVKNKKFKLTKMKHKFVGQFLFPDSVDIICSQNLHLDIYYEICVGFCPPWVQIKTWFFLRSNSYKIELQ